MSNRNFLIINDVKTVISKERQKTFKMLSGDFMKKQLMWQLDRKNLSQLTLRQIKISGIHWFGEDSMLPGLKSIV